MADGESANQNETQTTPEEIDPQILSSLGLTPEDVQNYNRQKLEDEEALSELKEQGAKLYSDIQRGFKSVDANIRGLLFSVMNASPKQAHLTPVIFFDTLEKAKLQRETNPEYYKKIEKDLHALIEGYGQAALDNNDWQSAVNAFDLVTDGGILSNQNAMTKLGELFPEDKTARVDIAQAIQERVNLRKAQQTPEPTLTPVPPPPSPVEV